MMAPSSMIQPEPMTIGPAMANMVALGWTMVPGTGVSTEGGVAGAGTTVRTCADGDVAFELYILADDGL